MTVITEDGGRQNMYAKEPRMYYSNQQQETIMENGEKLNGRLAMIGIVAAMGTYALTGQIIPGLF